MSTLCLQMSWLQYHFISRYSADCTIMCVSYQLSCPHAVYYDFTKCATISLHILYDNVLKYIYIYHVACHFPSNSCTLQMAFMGIQKDLHRFVTLGSVPWSLNHNVYMQPKANVAVPWPMSMSLNHLRK